MWLGGVVVLLAAVTAWAALLGPGGPPPTRPAGAGLPPAPLARAAIVTTEPDPGLAARRAEIAAEESRLATLRSARVQLEQDVATLRQQAEERRREMPGRKVVPDGAAAGLTIVPGPATGGGPAPQPAALPQAAEPTAPRNLRIVVHHRANSGPGASAAEEVAQTLRGAGFDVPTVRGAPFVPSTPVVRYFHEEDQAAAARLAGRLGRGWAIQDFRAYLPQPAPQSLEVWVPGN